MTSLVRRLVGSQKSNSADKNDGLSSTDGDSDEIVLSDAKDSEQPYIINSIYYLSIIFLIGVPMWFYTCSPTRHALPDVSQLESKLVPPGPRLHLDISVVQMSASQSNQRDSEQSDFLRENLPNILETSVEDVAYHLNWRIRRPTVEESQVMRTLIKENEKPPTTEKQRHAIYTKLEENLLRIHKASHRFRLFMYIFDGPPASSLVCTAPNSFSLNFERFIYICPGDSIESVATLIKEALNETYQNTVDTKRVKKILDARTDLLMSLIPETPSINLSSLSHVADKVHSIHEKNVKSKYLELAGILNIRLITSNNYVLQDVGLDKMLIQRPGSKAPQSNSTVSEDIVRKLDADSIGRYLNAEKVRLTKHSSQSVHHVFTIIPDQSKPRVAFQATSEEPVHILEEQSTDFILLGIDDRSLVLGMRAVIRRIIGLNSPNLSKNSLIRRDVFLNKWELDAVVGALTILKLHSVFESLKSIAQPAVGIKIPKRISTMALEAHSLALESLEKLHKKEPLGAYHSISSAQELSGTAFFHPTLLDPLYFPEETKYAIYVPLFMPIGLPLALSMFKIGRYLVSNCFSRQKVKMS